MVHLQETRINYTEIADRIAVIQPGRKSRIVFLHVPKTAGSTLWSILRRQYFPEALLRVDDLAEFPALTSQQWAESRVLLGHFAYGVPIGWSAPPPTITVLRDPVERLLSHYGHVARTKYHPLVRKAFAKTGRGLTLEDYLASDLVTLDNEQTRMLAGPEALTLPVGCCDREVFEAAKRHLTENIALTGLTERFDETLLLLQKMFGWNLPCYISENIGTARLRQESLSPEMLQRLNKITHWDQELYALAAERLDRQIFAAGPTFNASLHRFRRANLRYRWMKSLVASGPLCALKRRFPLERQMGMESIVRSLLRHISP